MNIKSLELLELLKVLELLELLELNRKRGWHFKHFKWWLKSLEFRRGLPVKRFGETSSTSRTSRDSVETSEALPPVRGTNAFFKFLYCFWERLSHFYHVGHCWKMEMIACWRSLAYGVLILYQ
ncbi:MAG: hypothetical protein MUP71_11650 [Candidatus Aminicenantes bacterium]|nr:hypothetical protein [Candidatus Aminicenantes bacterium]